MRPHYADHSLGAGTALIELPHNGAILPRVVSEYNTRAPDIDAMVTNIDLTGYIIELEDGTTPETEPGKDILTSRISTARPTERRSWCRATARLITGRWARRRRRRRPPRHAATVQCRACMIAITKSRAA